MASDLDRAILAAREGNLTQMKFFYTRHLLQNPNDVKVWAEYLQLLLRMSNVSKDAGGIDPRVLSSLLAWKKPPLKTVEECLDTLFTAPNQLASLFKIGKAAQEAGWLETAVFMFSRVLALGDRLSPESMRTVKLELGRSFHATQRFEEALKVLEEFEHDTRLPQDLQQIVKDLPARAALSRIDGRKLTDGATSQSMKIAAQKPEEEDHRKIEELEKALDLQQGQKALNTGLSLASLYLKTRSFDQALSSLKRAHAKYPSSELDKKIVEVELERRSVQIRQAGADGNAQGDRDARVGELDREKWQYAAGAYGELLKKRPTDAEVHIRYGQALFHSMSSDADEARLVEAVSHLQYEGTNVPDWLSHQAAVLIAQCFLAMGLPKLAKSHLEQLVATIRAGDASREVYLEAHLLMGQAAEAIGDTAAALQAYLSVVQKDIRFRDALQRVKSLEQRSSRG